MSAIDPWEVIRNLELLEERIHALIVLEDDKRLRVLEKNPYTLLKYKCYRGKKIRFISKEGGPISLEETDRDGVFECSFNGSKVTITDSQIQVASAVFDAHERKSFNAIYSLWKLKYVERFLDITTMTEANSPVELTREGKLLLPKSVLLQILEWTQRPDGGRVVKAQLRRGQNSTRDRIFTHEVQLKGRTRAVVNDTAVALIGRDETGQCWMHIVPPEYSSRSIDSCEMWLAGGDDEKDELIDVLASKE
jgi:hypothetical protein